LSESIAVFSKISATDETTGLDFEELAQAKDVLVILEGKLSGGSNDNSLTLGRAIVNSLKHTNGEGGSFTGSRLGLCNNIA